MQNGARFIAHFNQPHCILQCHLFHAMGGKCESLTVTLHAALSVITLGLSLIGGVFLILAAESPSGREVNVSELFVCVRGGGGRSHALHGGKWCSVKSTYCPAILHLLLF